MKAFWFLVDIAVPAFTTAVLLAALLAQVWMTQVWVFDAR